MEIEDIVSLVEQLVKHDIGEFDATFGATRVTIRREALPRASLAATETTTTPGGITASDMMPS